MGEFTFSKGELKGFIHWVFKQFLNTNWDTVHLRSSWDEIGKKLYLIQANGDLSVMKFFPLFHIIIKAFELMGDGSGKVSGPQLQTPSPLSSPRVPKPSSLPEGQSAVVVTSTYRVASISLTPPDLSRVALAMPLWTKS